MNKQRLIRNICLGLFFFLSGVEYAVILPTLNGYLTTFNAEQAFLGIVMSAFSFTGLVAAPIYGRITDRTRSTKLCIIIGNFFEIGGNIMYFTSSNKYTVLGARLIAGIGSGVASSIFGMISRTTSEQERTAMFSLFMSLRQMGLIAGPAFNLFLHSLDFYIGTFHINEYTSPGLLMAVLWLLHTVFLTAAYKGTEKKPENVEAVDVNEYEEIKDDKTQKFRSRSKRATSIFEDPRVRTFSREFVREEVIVCLTITFMVMFSQTGIETVTTPLTLMFFGWGSLENSYLFCGASAVAVASFICMSLLSKRFSDRILILFGCFGMVFTYALFVAYVTAFYFGHYSETPPWVLPIFMTNVATLTISIPYLWVPQAALFSKVTSSETQAFNQGIRMVAMGLGQILGPIWASSMATMSRLPIMVGVDFFLMLMITFMVVLSYKRLQGRETTSSDKKNLQASEESSTADVLKNTVNENSPLISGEQGSKIPTASIN